MLDADSQAVIIGQTGAIGGALFDALIDRYGADRVTGFSRQSDPALDLLDETSIKTCAARLAARERPVGLVFDATGYLHGQGYMPERSWREVDPDHLMLDYRLNAIGPALLMKHFLPLLPRKGRSIFASLSARVGSIEDNRLGGWHSYRASKAALNQLIRTHAIELARKKPDAICVAVHPGTVTSALSEPFSKSGLAVRAPEVAASDIMAVLENLSSDHTGQIFDYKGQRIPF